MFKQSMAAALMAGGLVLGVLGAPSAQAAVPLAKIQTGDAARSDVVKVKRGGGFGGFRGGGFRGGPFSSGYRGFNGGGFRAYGSRRNFGGWGGRRHIYGGWNGGWNRGYRRRHYGYRRFYGPGVYFGTGYGYRSCGYLRRRAVVTGSRYWWRRYQQCRYGY